VAVDDFLDALAGVVGEHRLAGPRTVQVKVHPRDHVVGDRLAGPDGVQAHPQSLPLDNQGHEFAAGLGGQFPDLWPGNLVEADPLAHPAPQLQKPEAQPVLVAVLANVPQLDERAQVVVDDAARAVDPLCQFGHPGTPRLVERSHDVVHRE